MDLSQQVHSLAEEEKKIPHDAVDRLQTVFESASLLRELQARESKVEEAIKLAMVQPSNLISTCSVGVETASQRGEQL